MAKHEMTREALEQQELLWAAASVLVGVCLGFALELLLSWYRLRWTWALGGVPLTWALSFVDLRLAAVCVSSTAIAVLFGLMFRIPDHFEGGERARLARDAIGPLQLACALIASRSEDDLVVLPRHGEDVEH